MFRDIRIQEDIVMNTRKYLAGQALAGIMQSVTGLSALPYEMKQIGELARDCADSCIAALKEKPLKKELEEQERIDHEKEISDIESIKGSLIPSEIDNDILFVKSDI